MASFPSGNGSRPADVTDPKGPDAQDKRVGKMHDAALASRKAQRNATHAYGKKGK